MPPPLTAGTPVSWQPLTHIQKNLHKRFPSWVIAQGELHRHICGEVTVMIQPVDRPDMVRPVRIGQIQLETIEA